MNNSYQRNHFRSLIRELSGEVVGFDHPIMSTLQHLSSTDLERKNIMEKSPDVTAEKLSEIYHYDFAGGKRTRYRLDWHQLRWIARQAYLTEEYLADINKSLNIWNLKLTSHLDFLVVDNLDPIDGLRKLSGREIGKLLRLDRERYEHESDDNALYGDEVYGDEQ